MERVETRHTSSSAGSSSSTQPRPHYNGATHGSAARRKSTMSTIQDDEPNETEASPRPKQSMMGKMAALWAKTGIDSRTYQSMLKSSLAPTITLALYQLDSFANYYTTLGYLSIVMTIISIVIMPRAKLLQTMLVNILFTSIGAALSLLAMYCCIRARGGNTDTYNSSASAVGGCWLIFQVFWISVVRAKMPQYNIPGIMWAIFANVSMIYGPQFSSMAVALSFTRRLFVGFLTGFGVATIVSLLVFPLNSRQVAFKGITGYIASLRGALQANLEYMHSLELDDMFAAATTNTIGEKQPKSAESKVFKQKMASLAALHGRLSTDLPFAKREVAIGMLGPDDIQETFRLLRQIMIPTVGLSCMADIFVRIAEDRGWDRDVDFSDAKPEDARNESEKIRIEMVNEWHGLMQRLREPFDQITQTIDNGLEHVRVVLQLGPNTWKKVNEQDVEKEGVEPKPGHKDFAAVFLRHSIEFHESKKVMLREWCHLHDIELPAGFFEDPNSTDFEAPSWMHEGVLSEPHQKLRRQLFLCLYMEFLLISIARRTYRLIIAVDTFREHGKLSKKRLVVPGYKRMRKWLRSLFKDNEDVHEDNEMATDGQQAQVYLGDAYKKKKDPEHLPPANAWERFGNRLRMVAHFFQSPAAAFGLRAAAATMCIAVIGFLRKPQGFFTEQRLFWAQIMVSIAMSPTAGQSLRGFFFRAGGTALALVTSLIAWYIVDEHTAGIIVCFFVVMHLGAYIMLKHPVYIQVGVIFQITNALIIGYELQVRKIGVVVATTNGQAYYPVYQLGPIRLATVLVGLFVGWIWTWFPYPITEHNQLRKQLGSSLYLLANYYSVMHETVRLRLRDQQGDMALKDSPGRRLEKARNKLYSKASLTISSLRAQAQVVKYDIPVGGKFPREQYLRLINHLQSILNFMSLVSVASYSFEELRAEGEEQHGLKWLHGFQKLMGETNYTSEQVTTLLTLLSASITTEQALPPYLRVPEPYILSQKLDDMDKDILSIRHIAEPGYASFAVVQIGTKFIYEDLRRLVAGVKDLVGELDFSYHIVSVSDPSRDESEETLVLTRTRANTTSRSKQD
ncbi:Putative ER transporter, 6TM [Septoria linicola]|uniref:ER transporter, 6TM n=1 Tax=Septoria linicola TaxID=215465 RepID=A0A9Q9AP35_9PEZI|nr:putative ER transporter, 6TM [Septoria linicola]USW49633.1 Putative ER transporter, 6TM [Septoria linicola]